MKARKNNSTNKKATTGAKNQIRKKSNPEGIANTTINNKSSGKKSNPEKNAESAPLNKGVNKNSTKGNKVRKTSPTSGKPFAKNLPATAKKPATTKTLRPQPLPEDLRYYVCYKPYGMLCQFTNEKDSTHPVLADLHGFETDVYAVGHLDRDSEGLLLLTNDREWSSRIAHPIKGLTRTFMLQVEGDITPDAVEQLQKGVLITNNGKIMRTASAVAQKLNTSPALPERNPPVRYRKAIPTSWVKLTTNEITNRQMRQVTAVLGFPTLRLVQTGFGPLQIADMTPRLVRALNEKEVQKCAADVK